MSDFSSLLTHFIHEVFNTTLKITEMKMISMKHKFVIISMLTVTMFYSIVLS